MCNNVNCAHGYLSSNDRKVSLNLNVFFRKTIYEIHIISECNSTIQICHDIEKACSTFKLNRSILSPIYHAIDIYLLGRLLFSQKMGQ